MGSIATNQCTFQPCDSRVSLILVLQPPFAMLNKTQETGQVIWVDQSTVCFQNRCWSSAQVNTISSILDSNYSRLLHAGWSHLLFCLPCCNQLNNIVLPATHLIIRLRATTVTRWVWMRCCCRKIAKIPAIDG